MSTTTARPQTLEEALASIPTLHDLRDMLNANDYAEYAEDYFAAKALGGIDFEDYAEDFNGECPTFEEMTSRWSWDEEED